MAWHLYLVPVIGDGTEDNPRRAKYIEGISSPSPTYAMPYGSQPVMLAAADLDDAQDAAIVLNADVQKIPDNLDMQIGSVALSIIQNALESRHLPSQWVTDQMTYRTLLRTIANCFKFLQRYRGFTSSGALVFGGAVDLDTQFNQLPVAARNTLRDVAASMNLNTSGLSGATRLRAILKDVADQLGNVEVRLGGITI